MEYQEWDQYEQGYNEARADLIAKLLAKIQRRELTSVRAVGEYLETLKAKAKSVGRWPPGWE